MGGRSIIMSAHSGRESGTIESPGCNTFRGEINARGIVARDQGLQFVVCTLDRHISNQLCYVISLVLKLADFTDKPK